MKQTYIYTVIATVLLCTSITPLLTTAQSTPITLAQAPGDKTPTGIQPAGTPNASQSGAKTGKGCKSATCIRDLLSLLQYVIYLVQNYLVSLIFALAMIFFLWNTAMFIWQPGDAKNKNENLVNIAKGVMGLFVMFAIYGILALISNSLNIGVGGVMEIPSFKVGK